MAARMRAAPGADGLRLALAVALLGALAAPAAAGKKKKDPPAIEPLSGGDARGPFAAALGPDGRLHVVFSERPSADAEPRLLYRIDDAIRGWSPPEEVLARAPGVVTIAAASWGPVVVFLADGAVQAARRDERGWKTVSLLAGADRATAVAAASTGDKVQVVFAGQRQGDAGKPFLARVVLDAEGSSPVRDFDLPSPGSGTVVALALAPAAGGDHVAFARRTDSKQVLSMGIGPEASGLVTLHYSRIGERLLPPLGLATTGRLDQLAMVLVDRDPALVWTAQGLGSTRLLYQGSAGGRFHSPETLLEDPEGIYAIGAAASSSKVLVAAVYGKSLHQIRARWLIGDTWGEWQQPAGIDRYQGNATSALVALMDENGRARVLARERVLPVEGGSERLMDWTLLPGMLTLSGH